jgi:predicted CoA-binding protein
MVAIYHNNAEALTTLKKFARLNTAKMWLQGNSHQDEKDACLRNGSPKFKMDKNELMRDQRPGIRWFFLPYESGMIPDPGSGTFFR